MPLRKLKPVTPGQRFTELPDFSEITQTEPNKALTVGLRKKGGRNNLGRITAYHRGKGHKRSYRLIDWKIRPGEVKVLSIEYDPNRSGRIALVQYPDGRKTYILAPSTLEVNQKIRCETAGKEIEAKVGNRLLLRNIPEGANICNMELVPGEGGRLVRSAGTTAVLMVKTEKFGQVKLPSGEIRLIPLECSATIGQISNPEHKYVSLGKAGRKRWLGIRPTVRGVAMNPVDHPHGGGEGRSKGHISSTPWGKPTKGYKTRYRKKPSNKFIIKKRK